MKQVELGVSGKFEESDFSRDEIDEDEKLHAVTSILSEKVLRPLTTVDVKESIE